MGTNKVKSVSEKFSFFVVRSIQQPSNQWCLEDCGFLSEVVWWVIAVDNSGFFLYRLRRCGGMTQIFISQNDINLDSCCSGLLAIQMTGIWIYTAILKTDTTMFNFYWSPSGHLGTGTLAEWRFGWLTRWSLGSTQKYSQNQSTKCLRIRIRQKCHQIGSNQHRALQPCIQEFPDSNLGRSFGFLDHISLNKAFPWPT